MLQPETDATYKYNCAVWLQGVESNIKKQRIVVAQLLIAQKDYSKEITQLHILYKSRVKLIEERKKFYSNNESKEVILFQK